MSQFRAKTQADWGRKFLCQMLRGTPLLALTALIATLVSSQPLLAETSDRPSVVLIMTDDMGYSDLGCFGGEIRTPNLDRLAGGGLRLSNFYSENMCWVSRAAMLTGIYHRTSLKNGAMHPRCVTLPDDSGSS